MVDVNVMRNVTRSSQFFASTTMLILGALIALTGYVQQALDLVSGMLQRRINASDQPSSG
jgi:uncharacterized membrane protein